MKKGIPNFVVLAVLMSASLWSSACMTTEDSGAVGMTVSALTETCSGLPGNEPLKSIDSIWYEVTGPDRESGSMVTLASDEVPVVDGMASINISSVETGLDNVVTIIGMDGGKAAWYGRHRDVSVVQGRTSTIDILLTRFGGFTCISPPTEFTPRVFSSVVTLGDGRMLVTGGLTGKEELDSSTYNLKDPSKQAFIFNQSTGTYDYVGEMMEARAGHASVFLPMAGGDKVLIFGGTSKVRMKTGGTFPLSVDSADSLDSYEIYDVKTGTFSSPGDGATKKMRLPRAFLSAVRLFDNTVLITGGGSWSSYNSGTKLSWPADDNPDYRFAEVWAPYADNNVGGMLDLGDRMPMNSQHNGAAVVKLEDTSQGLSRYLFVGGSPIQESNVEIFTQSSKLEDGAGAAFKQRTVDGLPLIYFPSVTRIKDGNDGSRRFLVVGGVSVKNGVLSASPLKGYVLNITPDDVVTSTKLNSECAQRYMHGAVATFDQDAVMLLGGFSNNTGISDKKSCVYDVCPVCTSDDNCAAGEKCVKFTEGNFCSTPCESAAATTCGSGRECSLFMATEPTNTSKPAKEYFCTQPCNNANGIFSEITTASEQFLSRAAFAAGILPDDTLFIAGGMISAGTLDGSASGGMAEIYTPSALWTADAANGGN